MVTKATAAPAPALDGDAPPGGAPGAALHATVTGDGPPVILLHGLFGMGSNLGSVARALAPSFKVHQVDLPNHGRSPWMQSMGLTDLADAIAAYCDHAGIDRAAFLGHSLGGKVAMQLALRRPERVTGLVVADIAPVEYAPSHGAVFAGLADVAASPPASRADAATVLRRHLEEDAVVQFLLLSLVRGDDRCYHWRFNVEALAANYDRLREAPRGGAYPGPVLFLYGALSSYVDASGLAAAATLFPEMQSRAIAGTGHWLHAEKPAEFNAAAVELLTGALGKENR